MEKQPCVYLLSNSKRGTLYLGVTSDIVKRVWEHKNNLVEGFSEKYSIHQLVWYEQHVDMKSAIEREKSMKKWKRDWKIALIEEQNPEWRDLYESLL